MATDGSARLGSAMPARDESGPSMLTIGGWVVTCAALVVVLLVVGGYGLGWSWTGLSHAVTLWDWLQALLLPVALGVAPVLLLYRGRLRSAHHVLLLGGLAAFTLLIVAGYLIPLPWTGFPGHTLWDWFELALLPLVVTAAPIWVRADRIRRQHLAAGAVLLLVFAAFVAAGYAVPLGWTGFDDNTAWDWLKLLLLPLLIPTVVVPLLTSRMHEALAGAPPSTDPDRGRSA